MKKLVVVLLVLVGVWSMACADCFWWGQYDMNDAQYIVCGYDENVDECFTAVVDVFALEEMAWNNQICSAYVICCDGVCEIGWDYITDNDGNIIEFIVWETRWNGTEWVDGDIIESISFD